MNIFQKHVVYLKDNPNRLWFKRKLYGWGWTPATKEGWLVILVYVILVLFFALSIDNNSSNNEIMFIFVIPFVLLTFTLIRICYRKGEKPRWSWGQEVDSQTADKSESN